MPGEKTTFQVTLSCLHITVYRCNIVICLIQVVGPFSKHEVERGGRRFGDVVDKNIRDL